MKLKPDAAVNHVDLSFMDARARLLDIAAWLDRIERYGQTDDYRVKAFEAALLLLAESGAGRTKAILLALGDPGDEPIPEAHTKGAAGAFSAGQMTGDGGEA